SDTLNGGSGNDTIITDVTVLTGYTTETEDLSMDIINAGAGDDVIITAGSADIISGGTGSDIFTYSKIPAGVDTITDFDISNDMNADDDILNLGDLLSQDTSYANVNLDDYIRVTGGTLQVSSSGNFADMGSISNIANLSGVNMNDTIKIWDGDSIETITVIS
ncbi:MAG: type I secretion C-terminal target domain-containing protein, partial [Coxiellaceae bacterium]|nr:type I secretion C-terminal target domain-containing protein [Coxiellaceae bacterium]